MAAIEIGRICIKRTGREAGKKAVIIDFQGELAVIDGKEVKRRKCNVKHLFPTGKKIEIKKGASHEEIIKLLK